MHVRCLRDRDRRSGTPQGQGSTGNAEIQARELRRVANEYCEDTLKRTEEAVALGLEEVRKARQRFKSIAK